MNADPEKFAMPTVQSSRSNAPGIWPVIGPSLDLRTWTFGGTRLGCISVTVHSLCSNECTVTEILMGRSHALPPAQAAGRQSSSCPSTVSSVSSGRSATTPATDGRRCWRSTRRLAQPPAAGSSWRSGSSGRRAWQISTTKAARSRRSRSVFVAVGRSAGRMTVRRVERLFGVAP